MKNFSSYPECLEYLYGLQRFGIKFGFNNINYLLDKLGSPHNKFKSIHVAGTNGKGSTTTILGAILKAAGYKVGIYTSPHLVDYCERIIVDGKPIPQKKIVELTNQIINIIQDMPNADKTHPTYFEVTTAQAFQYFAESEVDFAIVEVGMGGRLDATNVINPLLSIITSIGLEHTEILGDTLYKIAGEKAGIIKHGIPVVTGVSDSESLEPIINKSAEKQSDIYILNKNFSYKIKSLELKGSSFDYFGIENNFNNLFVSLSGEHQIHNTALALAGIEILKKHKNISVDENIIRKGLNSVYWPGRLEIISESPYILLDGAHNPDGALTLKKNINKFFHNKKIYFIIGILKDKNREKILETLCPLAHEIILTTISYERASSPEELYEIAKKYSKNITLIPTVESSITYAKSRASKDDIICISGSLYILGEAIGILKQTKSAL
ncbi:bifunctional folylpolyglutamate synthase/dihydrofolate synthase [Candidatus Poribacteria bacterium]|nr:bifunctional folylpolyglutamate synthase/dihydrofolate synthase [Candidatus Poribacteria bacterium]